MSQFVEGMAMAADCATKGLKTVCPKCGRSLPDTCGEKHPRVAVIEEPTADPTAINPDVSFVEAEAKFEAAKAVTKKVSK